MGGGEIINPNKIGPKGNHVRDAITISQCFSTFSERMGDGGKVGRTDLLQEVVLPRCCCGHI